MRVLSVVTQLEAGGAQTVAFDVTEELRRRGHDAGLCFFYTKRPAYGGRAEFDVLMDRRPRSVSDAVTLLRLLRGKLRAERPDAVICFTHYANVIGAMAAMTAGVPARIVSHQNPRGSYPVLAQWADSLLGATGVYSAAAACSSSVRDSFEGVSSAYRRRMVVAPNGIAPRPSSMTRAEARERFRLPAEAPIVLSAGRLAPQKNQRALVRAIAGVEALHLAIAGDGELRQALTEEVAGLGVESRVHFLGQVPPDAMPELFAAVDIFAMPSLFEGLSLVLLEAMHAGLPIVASDIAAMTDVLRTDAGDCGLLVPLDTDGALAAALARLAADPVLRQALAARARGRADDFLIGKTTSVYEGLLPHGDGR